MRVLDSKDENDQKFLKNVPLMKDHLCQECSSHFDDVLELLNRSNTPFVIDGKLVRGLDYYTKTAFEITSRALGSQDALAGGGRYDLLVEELGGKPTPGVGFAAGIERLLMVLKKQDIARQDANAPKLYIVTADDSARSWAFLKASELRTHGLSVEIDYLNRSVKAQMRDANRLCVEFVVVVGERELKDGTCNLKNMRSGEGNLIPIDRLANALQ